MRIPRSYLYVPGDRPDRLAKATSRQADAIVADLEDAVADNVKDAALGTVLDWLDSVADGTSAWVRVNSGGRREHEIAELAAHPALDGLFLPKVDQASEVDRASRIVRSAGRKLKLAPMIESAKGLVNIHAIAVADDVYQLHIGEMDLAADLDVSPSVDAAELLFARSLVVIASRNADLIAPAAPVSAEIDDIELYKATTEQLRRLGYYGRDCIHPAQVVSANEAYTARPEERAWAEWVLQEAKTSPGAFRDQAGSMVDEAVLRRARRILASGN